MQIDPIARTFSEIRPLDDEELLRIIEQDKIAAYALEAAELERLQRDLEQAGYTLETP